MRRFVVLTVVVAGALSIVIVRAQPSPEAVQIQKVKDSLYIVTGGRGTSAQGNGIAIRQAIAPA